MNLMNYIRKFKFLLFSILIIFSIITINIIYKDNLKQNRFVIVDASLYAGIRHFNIYDDLKSNFDNKFSVILRSIDNSPSRTTFIVENSIHNYFQTYYKELCELITNNNKKMYYENLSEGKVKCFKNEKNIKKLFFIKLVGPVDNRIINKEYFFYKKNQYIRLIYDL
tara:strand:- start:1550 stop:2050 length:501 start_codon:yes stop_codon:yes gene_type:complete